MCGRFGNPLAFDDMAARWHAVMNATYARIWKPTWNAAPTMLLPVVIQDADGRRLGSMRWGWRRSFSKAPLVNAIGEQAPEKKTFRDAFLRRRCLVPATAFYEWKPKGEVGMPLPYAFGRADREPFAIAGLWEREPGEEEGRFLLLTVPANGVVAPVHHRMAAMLPPEAETRWLDPAATEDELRAVLVPYPTAQSAAWRVSPKVSSVRNDGPELLAEV